MANNLPIAILIDGDNASPEKLNEVIRFATTYGNPIIKRIYADWLENPARVDPVRQVKLTP